MVKRKRPDPKSRDFPAPPGPECSGLCDLPGAENFPEDSPTKQFYKDKLMYTNPPPIPLETSSLYLKADSGEYLELVKFKEKRGSWIVEDFVEPDGSLYVATPMDPLFFAVALLQKSNKFRPLEDFVEDNLYPNLLSVINSCSSRLRHVADIKELGEDRVYRYNESKCIAWLTKKVKAVAAALESADIQVGATCVTAALVRSKRDTRPTNVDGFVSVLYRPSVDGGTRQVK
ncbi:hypothetical protein HPB51_027458 [Rhipicephalus microplus]|uniref:Ribonuclease H2 subunit B wHTH domain-containing protein n=1 Tax=Rhipicephalus microplus TaxID=6941 RepID=A0A9J6CZS7_RHIMP|nr:hypothetical protein HPB51_027458 [Rhipicephalus microplus]